MENLSSRPGEFRRYVNHLMSVAELWSRIREIYAAHDDLCDWTFNAPASDADVARLQNAVPQQIPQDYLASLRVHDGCAWLPGYGELLTVDETLRQREMYSEWQRDNGYGDHTSTLPDSDTWYPRQIDGPIKPYWWKPSRLFVTDSSGDHIAIDFDPPDNGSYGQVIDHSHETGPSQVVADSWTLFLTRFITDLENG